MNKKLVIFDLDGTLLDTSVDLMNSMNGMLKFFSYPEITLEQTKRYIGHGARNFVLSALPDFAKDNVDAALKKYNEIYNASGSPETRIYDGMAEVLRYLKAEGCLIAIVSNKPQKSTDEVYKRYLECFSFDYVYGNREGFAHKPDKACGEFILEKLGVRAEDAVVVGDGETDVEFSFNLGCRCVAVTWGFRERGVLAKSGADVFAENPFELKEKLIEFISDIRS